MIIAVYECPHKKCYSRGRIIIMLNKLQNQAYQGVRHYEAHPHPKCLRALSCRAFQRLYMKIQNTSSLLGQQEPQKPLWQGQKGINRSNGCYAHAGEPAVSMLFMHLIQDPQIIGLSIALCSSNLVQTLIFSRFMYSEVLNLLPSSSNKQHLYPELSTPDNCPQHRNRQLF